MSLHAVFRAGFIHRWHTNPDLCHTNDRVDGHSGRVARLILLLHPNPSRNLIMAALSHDDGEHAVGDMRAPLKDEFPEIADALESLECAVRESLWGEIPLSVDETDWLKFCDRLDAYMWAQHFAPHVLSDDGWPEARARLQATAIALNVIDKVAPVIGREP
jgi:5'-deoxynucleotidase